MQMQARLSTSLAHRPRHQRWSPFFLDYEATAPASNRLGLFVAAAASLPPSAGQVLASSSLEAAVPTLGRLLTVSPQLVNPDWFGFAIDCLASCVWDNLYVAWFHLLSECTTASSRRMTVNVNTSPSAGSAELDAKRRTVQLLNEPGLLRQTVLQTLKQESHVKTSTHHLQQHSV